MQHSRLSSSHGFALLLFSLAGGFSVTDAFYMATRQTSTQDAPFLDPPRWEWLPKPLMEVYPAMCQRFRDADRREDVEPEIQYLGILNSYPSLTRPPLPASNTAGILLYTSPSCSKQSSSSILYLKLDPSISVPQITNLRELPLPVNENLEMLPLSTIPWKAFRIVDAGYPDIPTDLPEAYTDPLQAAMNTPFAVVSRNGNVVDSAGQLENHPEAWTSTVYERGVQTPDDVGQGGAEGALAGMLRAMGGFDGGDVRTYEKVPWEVGDYEEGEEGEVFRRPRAGRVRPGVLNMGLGVQKEDSPSGMIGGIGGGSALMGGPAGRGLLRLPNTPGLIVAPYSDAVGKMFPNTDQSVTYQFDKISIEDPDPQTLAERNRKMNEDYIDTTAAGRMQISPDTEVDYTNARQRLQKSRYNNILPDSDKVMPNDGPYKGLVYTNRNQSPPTPLRGIAKESSLSLYSFANGPPQEQPGTWFETALQAFTGVWQENQIFLELARLGDQAFNNPGFLKQIKEGLDLLEQGRVGMDQLAGEVSQYIKAQAKIQEKWEDATKAFVDLEQEREGQLRDDGVLEAAVVQAMMRRGLEAYEGFSQDFANQMEGLSRLEELKWARKNEYQTVFEDIYQARQQYGANFMDNQKGFTKVFGMWWNEMKGIEEKLNDLRGEVEAEEPVELNKGLLEVYQAVNQLAPTKDEGKMELSDTLSQVLQDNNQGGNGGQQFEEEKEGDEEADLAVQNNIPEDEEMGV